MEEEGVGKKEEGIDYFNPAIVMALLMAVMSDVAFFALWLLFVPVIGPVVATMVIAFHYFAAFAVAFLIFPKITKGTLLGNIAGTALLDVRSAMLLAAKIFLVLAIVLPVPLLATAIVVAIVFANKLVQTAATVALVVAAPEAGIAEALGGAAAKGAAAAAEAGAKAANGAVKAAEAAATAAEGVEAVAEAGVETTEKAGRVRIIGGKAVEVAKEEARGEAIEGAEEKILERRPSEKTKEEKEAEESKVPPEALGEEPPVEEELRKELFAEPEERERGKLLKFPEQKPQDKQGKQDEELPKAA